MQPGQMTGETGKEKSMGKAKEELNKEALSKVHGGVIVQAGGWYYVIDDLSGGTWSFKESASTAEYVAKEWYGVSTEFITPEEYERRYHKKFPY